MQKQTIHPDLTAAILRAWAELDYPNIWPLILRPDSAQPLVIRNADELRRQTIGAVETVTALE